MKLGILAGVAVLVTACGDDGHVVGDMATGGTSKSPNGSTDGSTSDGSSASSASSSGGNSSTSNNGASSSSGGMSSSTTGSANGTGGTSGSTDTSSGGVAGNGTNGSGGAAGAGGNCAAGEMWCPGCYPGEGFCSVACPGSACLDCADVQSEEDCDARIDCHSVYQDAGDCSCGTPGCCAQFSACTPGGTADCEGASLGCTVQEPHCEDPAFVISYTGACYEGCAKPEDCAAGTTTSGSGGTGGACDPACHATPDSVKCAQGEVYWACGPTPDNVDDFVAECTGLLEPQPSWCCAASLRSECL